MLFTIKKKKLDGNILILGYGLTYVINSQYLSSCVSPPKLMPRTLTITTNQSVILTAMIIIGISDFCGQCTLMNMQRERIVV